MADEAVRVAGLDQFRKELRKLDDAGLIEGLKDANFEVAELVVRSAKANASTRMENRAAATLKARRGQRRAEVGLGNARTPFAIGAEFGAGQNIVRRSVNGRSFRGYNQFRQWRGSDSGAGYFLYPAIRAETDKIVEVYGDSIDKLMSKAFPD